MFTFDHAFDKLTSNEEIFQKTTQNLIGLALQGYNATVFAYGATGAGKTYTMMGTDSTKGIMQLTIEQLYKKLNKRSDEVKMSYIEIYNENIHDLLTGKNENLDLLYT